MVVNLSKKNIGEIVELSIVPKSIVTRFNVSGEKDNTGLRMDPYTSRMFNGKPGHITAEFIGFKETESQTQYLMFKHADFTYHISPKIITDVEFPFAKPYK